MQPFRPALLLLALVAPTSTLASAAAPTPAVRSAPAPAQASAPRTTSRPDIVLVTFDTVRRDHLSCYGHDKLTTPRIDSLAAGGIRFTDCQAVIPITGPSHASMLTGLYPQVHGAFRNGVPLQTATTLPEILRKAGYRTAAVVSGWTLKQGQCGLGRGFDVYDDAGMDERYSVVNLMRRAEDVTDAALAWASSPATAASYAQPYFLFVHYFDPHEPYQSPLAAALPANPASDGRTPPEIHREQLDAYDREIAYADREMGRLLDGLEQRGMLEDAVVIFTTDHGQSFGENGYGGAEGAHGRRVTQTLLASPLVAWSPGRIEAGRTSSLPVSHLDLLPTITAFAQVSDRELPAGLPGADLSRVMTEAEAPVPWGRARRVRHAVTYRGAVGNKWNIFRWMQNKDSEQAVPLFASAIRDGRKIVIDFERPHDPQEFDLASDPYESRPLAASDPAQRKAWGREVLDWYDRTRTVLKGTTPTAADLENLRSLGYVE